MLRYLSATVALMLASSGFAAVTLYVAHNGNDAAAGTLQAPFATLERARDEVRKLKAAGPTGPVTVWVGGGIYELSKPFALTAGDRGTPLQPVVYRALDKAPPVLVGARRIRGFKPWKGQILQCDLKGTALEGVVFRQLFYNGKRMIMARYPNHDPNDPHGGEWAYVLSSEPVSDHQPRSTSDTVARSKMAFTAMPGVVKPTWEKVEQAEVGIHPAYGGAWNLVPVKSADPATGVITFARPVGYGIMVGDRYFIRNLLAELDSPGEWYLDREAKTLYFWPPEPLSERSVVLAPVTSNIVTLDGADNVTLRGFTIEACDGDAVKVSKCEGSTIGGCTIRNCGAWAITIADSRNSGASGNDLYATGAGGINLNAGDRKTLTRGDCFADNNYIHHIAEFQKTYNTGVNLGGVGNRASHNLIHDCYHQAILMGGNDNTVEYNVIHHTNLGSEDTGGLYMSSRDFTMRGNVIRHNIFHHLGGFGKANSWAPVKDNKVKFEYPHFTWGIYLDAPESGVTVYGNVLYSVPVCGMFNHSGSDNTWENNIIVDAPAFRASTWDPKDLQVLSYSYLKKLDQQGLLPLYLQHYPELKAYQENPLRHNTMFNCEFVRNICYYTPTGGQWLRDHNKAWGGQLVWTYRGHKDDFPLFKFDYNCVYGPQDLPLKFSLSPYPDPSKMLTWDEWRQTGQDANSICADPGFVNPARHDYRLKKDSPVFKLGFKPIPFEKIGPYKDELRATWPVVEAPGAAALGDFTTERYFVLPGGEKASQRVPAAYSVSRRSDVKVDGVLGEWPWGDTKALMELREEYSGGTTAGLPSLACAAYDDEALYIAVRNPMRRPDALVMSGPWGGRDGLEIAFQDAESKQAPILNLYGYPDGSLESVTTAGASTAQAEKLGKATEYRARRYEGGWECEWRIPWAATGIDPAKVKRLRFNLGVRKMEDNAWVIWRGTGGYTFDLPNAGMLILK
ncbi:MAG: right-handed parallel beta-helix repeat-containing protein [Armatimonadia bacterium]